MVINPALTSGIIFLGVFTQSLTGFGSALVCMAILPALVGLEIAAPLVALVSITLEMMLLVKYRKAFHWQAIKPLVLSALIGIPIGVWALRKVNEEIFLRILGFVIAGYAIYALLNIRLVKMKRPAWAYAMGFLSGLLGGAYNTSGPPVVIYGNCRGWQPIEFKTNLQGFFLISNLFVVANHAWQGNLTRPVMEYYLWSIPAILIGVITGAGLDRYLSPEVFRKIVEVLLIMLGIRLILP